MQIYLKNHHKVIIRASFWHLCIIRSKQIGLQPRLRLKMMVNIVLRRTRPSPHQRLNKEEVVGGEQ